MRNLPNPRVFNGYQDYLNWLYASYVKIECRNYPDYNSYVKIECRNYPDYNIVVLNTEEDHPIIKNHPGLHETFVEVRHKGFSCLGFALSFSGGCNTYLFHVKDYFNLIAMDETLKFIEWDDAESHEEKPNWNNIRWGEKCND